MHVTEDTEKVHTTKISNYIKLTPIPVAAPSKAWLCGRSLAGIAVSHPSQRHECLSLVTVAFCHAEFSATGRSLVQRIPNACGVSD